MERVSFFGYETNDQVIDARKKSARTWVLERARTQGTLALYQDFYFRLEEDLRL